MRVWKHEWFIGLGLCIGYEEGEWLLIIGPLAIWSDRII